MRSRALLLTPEAPVMIKLAAEWDTRRRVAIGVLDITQLLRIHICVPAFEVPATVLSVQRQDEPRL